MELNVSSFKDLILFGLNLGLLLGGIVVQLPQIYKILKNRSVAGLSEISWVLQVFSTGAYVSFNYVLGYPFMTWGDAFFAVVEYCIIVGSCWRFAPELNARSFRILYTSIFAALSLMTITKYMPSWLLMSLGLAPMPMVVIARMPQILLNYQQKHTGQLAFESLAMQVAGNTARIFSTLVMVPDRIILMSHIVAALFNGIPLAQVLFYWDNTQKFLKRGRAKKNAEDKNDSTAKMPIQTSTVGHRKRLEED